MNSTRIQFFDLARGLAIAFMVMQHAMLIYAHHMGTGSALGETFLLLGTAPAAPVFLCIMGLFVARSRKSTFVSGVMRGLKLFAFGYGLNLVRFVLPLLLVGNAKSTLEDSYSLTSLSLTVDIFQLAGLALIALSVIKRFLPWPKGWLALAMLSVLVSPLLWGRWQNIPGTSPLWGNGSLVFFPFFPWICYPLFGMWYGKTFMEPLDRKAWLIRHTLLGSVLLAAGIVSWNFFVVGDYSRSGLGVHLLITGFVLLWFAFCAWVTPYIHTTRVFKTLAFWSQHVTVMYVIQWVLFGWGMLVFGVNNQQALIAACLGIGVLALTHILTKIYVRFQPLTIPFSRIHTRIRHSG